MYTELGNTALKFPTNELINHITILGTIGIELVSVNNILHEMTA